MGVVYFSIIPTFEPSRYCKCWIVCFYYRNAVGNFSDTMNKAQECISNKISTRDSYVNSTDYSNFGIYTQNSISQDIELPIETERYKIEDATYVNGVPD